MEENEPGSMHKTRLENAHRIASEEGRCPVQLTSMVRQVLEEPYVQTLCIRSDIGIKIKVTAKSKRNNVVLQESSSDIPSVLDRRLLRRARVGAV